MKEKLYVAVCVYTILDRPTSIPVRKFGVGDRVMHHRGWMGEVMETDYNEESEVEVNWFGEEHYTAASRTSEKYLRKVNYLCLVEVGEDGRVPENFIMTGYVSKDATWVKNGDTFWESEIKLIPNMVPDKDPIYYRIEIKNKFCGHFH